MKIDLNKNGGDFLSVNTFLPKLKCPLLDLSVLDVLLVGHISVQIPKHVGDVNSHNQNKSWRMIRMLACPWSV